MKHPTGVKKKSEPTQEEKKHSTAGSKQLAFDFIKKMLNDQNTTKQNSHKMNGLRLSMSSGNSPNGPFKKIHKSSVNFVHDMKKHGIDKALDSVHAMK